MSRFLLMRAHRVQQEVQKERDPEYAKIVESQQNEAKSKGRKKAACAQLAFHRLVL